MVIQSRRVWISGQFLEAALKVEDGKIVQIYPYGTVKADVDYGTKRIVPGFIDVHTHGAYGFDTNDAEKDGLRNWMKRIPEEGVTAILPTTVTQMPDVLTAAVANVAEVVREGYEGAEILGIHFEGPYLDMEYKGAQPPEAIAVPSVEQFQMYQKAANGLIRYITLAPEHDPEFALTRYCKETGVVVSMGHSSATYEQAMMGIANGATSMTHVFNGMTPFHHRKPGPIGAGSERENVVAELICDGQHIHPSAVRMAFKLFPGRICLISDALRCCGMPDGQYTLGGQDVFLKGGIARLADGTIAGSATNLYDCMRKAVAFGIPKEQAILSATIVPAREIGRETEIGSIETGKLADFVVCDEALNRRAVYMGGRALEAASK